MNSNTRLLQHLLLAALVALFIAVFFYLIGNAQAGAHTISLPIITNHAMIPGCAFDIAPYISCVY